MQAKREMRQQLKERIMPKIFTVKVKKIELYILSRVTRGEGQDSQNEVPREGRGIRVRERWSRMF